MNRNFLNLAIILTILFGPILFYYTHTSKVEANSSTKVAVACGKPTVIKFSSELCMECKELEKIYSPVQAEYKDKVVFKQYSINSSDPAVKQLMKKYNVTVVPTLIYLDKNGKVIMKTEGSMPKAQLERNINRLL